MDLEKSKYMQQINLLLANKILNKYTKRIKEMKNVAYRCIKANNQNGCHNLMHMY